MWAFSLLRGTWPAPHIAAGVAGLGSTSPPPGPVSRFRVGWDGVAAASCDVVFTARPRHLLSLLTRPPAASNPGSPR